jgi:hypothetical protein
VLPGDADLSAAGRAAVIEAAAAASDFISLYLGRVAHDHRRIGRLRLFLLCLFRFPPHATSAPLSQNGCPSGSHSSASHCFWLAISPYLSGERQSSIASVSSAKEKALLYLYTWRIWPRHHLTGQSVAEHRELKSSTSRCPTMVRPKATYGALHLHLLRQHDDRIVRRGLLKL